MVPQILESLFSNVLPVISWSCHKHISPCSISLFLLCGNMGKWPSEIQKIIIKWNWCSTVSNSLVSNHFDHFYNNLHNERCTMTPCSKRVFVTPKRKIISGSRSTEGVKLQTLLLLWNLTLKGLKSCIMNIPKRPSTQELHRVFSLRRDGKFRQHGDH